MASVLSSSISFVNSLRFIVPLQTDLFFIIIIYKLYVLPFAPLLSTQGHRWNTNTAGYAKSFQKKKIFTIKASQIFDEFCHFSLVYCSIPSL